MNAKPKWVGRKINGRIRQNPGVTRRAVRR